MKSVLHWTEEASDDLYEIYLNAGTQNIAAAERLYTTIEEHVALLSTYPRLGVRRLDISQTSRMLVQGVYLIFYRTVPNADDGFIDEVYVIRIVRGDRELPQLLH